MIDHLYVALPPEQHLRMIELIVSTSREMLDVKVVPDLLQLIALRARIEDLYGVPVINVNDPSIQGFNSILKWAIYIAHFHRGAPGPGAPCGIIALLVKLTSRGPVFYQQERMGLDGKPFTILKFRSMEDDAERETGPVWAQQDDARVTTLGWFLRRSNLDELPQLWNVLRGGHVDCRTRGPSARISSSSSSTGSHMHHALTGYLSVFFAIWWAWMNFTWFASAYDADDVPYRIADLRADGWSAGAGRRSPVAPSSRVTTGRSRSGTPIMRLGTGEPLGAGRRQRPAVVPPPSATPRGSRCSRPCGRAASSSAPATARRRGSFVALAVLEMAVPAWAEARAARRGTRTTSPSATASSRSCCWGRACWLRRTLCRTRPGVGQGWLPPSRARAWSSSRASGGCTSATRRPTS